MATIYVPYKREEQPFVQAVMSRLEDHHDVRVDYNLTAGADWPLQQMQDMRESEVCLVFVSRGTRSSDFQHAEMGSARFCSSFLDGKQIIPALIDDVDVPRPLANLDALDLKHRDPALAASEIEEALGRRAPMIRLFISHAHQDGTSPGAWSTCSRPTWWCPTARYAGLLPGYQLDLGTMASPQLRRELGPAAGVIALLTPNSLSKDWVLFELGAAWANASMAIPLLAGGLQDRDIPGPFRGAAGGQMSSQPTIDHSSSTSFEDPRLAAKQPAERPEQALRVRGIHQGQELCARSAGRGIEGELRHQARRIGSAQGDLLDRVTEKLGARYTSRRASWRSRSTSRRRLCTTAWSSSGCTGFSAARRSLSPTVGRYTDGGSRTSTGWRSGCRGSRQRRRGDRRFDDMIAGCGMHTSWAGGPGRSTPSPGPTPGRPCTWRPSTPPEAPPARRAWSRTRRPHRQRRDALRDRLPALTRGETLPVRMRVE